MRYQIELTTACGSEDYQNICKMSYKITDARIEELRRLIALKDEMRDKIQTQKDCMQEMLDLLDEKTHQLILSSSRAAQEARGIPSFLLAHQDAIDALALTIGSLKEDYSGLERELEDLEQAMEST